MSVKLEKLENNIVKFEVTVEAEKFNEAMKKSYIKNAKKYNIPGFRKGKAPMNMIKKFYGEGVLYDDAINICCEETYSKAVEAHDIHPVDYPQIDIVEIGEGKDFIYSAQVTVMPEVELGEYKGVEVKKIDYVVSDDEVLNDLKKMQEKNARIEIKEEGTVEKGNITMIDFKGFIDGVAFEGGEGKDHSLEIGSGSFIGDFEDQLIGAAKGESREVKVSFPENYGKEELNGKPVLFQVTINEIKAKELPELDDEFAKEVSEFDTLEEVKSDIRKKLEETKAVSAKREFEEAVIDAVCANTKLEIPEVMIKKETDNMLKDLEARLKYQGLDLAKYYEYTNSSEEKTREYMKENAEKKVKIDLIITKIAKVENIVAEQEEINTKAAEAAKQYGGEDIEKTTEMLIKAQSEYLKIDIINEKVIKLLVESSMVAE